jgi:hypothetical protein
MNSPLPAPISSLVRLRRERDYALASLGLSLTISLAMVLSSFVPRAAVGILLEPQLRSNQQLLLEEQRLFQANADELQRTRVELARVRAALGEAR